MRAACSVSEGSDVLLLDVGAEERRRQLAERALAEVDLGELGHAGTDEGQVAAHAALKEAVREVDERAAKHAGV
jgi:hypothetical protein